MNQQLIQELNDNNNINETLVENDLADLFSNENWLNINEIDSNQNYTDIFVSEDEVFMIIDINIKYKIS